MDLKKAIIISFAAHCTLLVVLSSNIDWSWRNRNVPVRALEAHVVVKKQKNKDHLPKKIKAPKAQEPVVDKQVIDKPVVDAPIDDPKPLPHKIAPKKTDKADYSKALASLSQTFAQEIQDIKPEEPEGDVIPDASYFDQVYSLIKQSFVVPPHINGPAGQNLSAVIRIFLAADGALNKLELESSSGDEHFDKAVLEGTKRVNNFGAVPIFLQDVLRDRGLVIELCPFTCKER